MVGVVLLLFRADGDIYIDYMRIYIHTCMHDASSFLFLILFFRRQDSAAKQLREHACVRCRCGILSSTHMHACIYVRPVEKAIFLHPLVVPKTCKSDHQAGKTMARNFRGSSPPPPVFCIIVDKVRRRLSMHGARV